MNINIKTTDITLTDAISDYVNKRLDKVSKMLEGETDVQCDIELARTTGHHQKGEIFRAEIHIVGSGKNIYVSSEREDLYEAIDEVKDDAVRELQSDKSKRVSLLRRGGAKVKNMLKGLWPWGNKV